MQTNVPTKKLNDGLDIPAIGLGTYSLNGYKGAESIKQGIEAGYRLIDSAFNYENEGAVGKAVRESSVPRDQLRVCSKLPGRHHAYDKALVTIEESLLRTGLDYFDLYIIHWPNPKVDKYVEAWQAMIEAQKRGYVRSIGVSNFLSEHLERIIAETGVAPVLNQVELHPYFEQTEQRAANDKHQIITESWSPLGRGRGEGVLEDAGVQEIAATHGKTPTQVILRWHTQLGAVPIPKAGSLEHQQENLNIFDFELTEEQMSTISAFSKDNKRLWDQDPAEYEEF
ncbi:diketogulonate reductase-like aldo/keto reductase [Paenibacillus sp. SORGH_AS306]|uniref:aldo/keto reductase n=1 Tax=unclassified Paenibacillus TaxID=185978 RepID=UPI0027846655|nr:MULTISPECIES: aldo/keto reductase [unclassified Paenibacillus]MDQ1236199.1 diketogulonate reductase-like aldo/keto reductase [Paenibacillus sp. SORGH_AS_0306]MDR6108553.1 diketogulonate reductase-like aldo/keto reductase [Paenibacillus sp. SORGH_AS_0338]